MTQRRTSPRPLGLQLEFRSGLPIYEQIVRHVERRVAGAPRRLLPGERLPTVRGLAAELGVNFNTVARAYRLLAEAGVISTQQGRGTYILASQTSPSAGSRHTRLVAITRQYVELALGLGFSADQIKESVEGGL